MVRKRRERSGKLLYRSPNNCVFQPVKSGFGTKFLSLVSMSIRGEVALTLLWVSVLLTTPSRYRRFRLPERWKLINSLRFGSLNDRLTRQDRTQIATDRDVEPSTSFDDRQDRCNSRACLLTANYGSSFASRSRGLYRVFSQIVIAEGTF